MFCGQPGQGIHATRIFGLAFWDLVATVVASYLVQRFLFPTHPMWHVLLALLVLGTVGHRLLKIRTPVAKFVFRGEW